VLSLCKCEVIHFMNGSKVQIGIQWMRGIYLRYMRMGERGEIGGWLRGIQGQPIFRGRMGLGGVEVTTKGREEECMRRERWESNLSEEAWPGLMDRVAGGSSIRPDRRIDRDVF
jgi:hypothetical protein